ncbi:hypothetical protein HMPREF0322_02070 [Desulfitobacterium hafniense DP7]|uniref:Uncharacterized protein n=1 Tax=Desulfitobacterium hafniense DP7 TaxID=537010 RepID=G9XM84_DESHA|nr:hypothetical protein HMPREF0322_02070 [Desulfitobacterium hafniense DP7]
MWGLPGFSFGAFLSPHSLSQGSRPCRLSGVGKDGKSGSG